MTDDEKRIRELHAGFVEANTTGDVAFLRAHMAPGKDTLTWFNLNQSNYVGVDHISELWQFLSGVSAGRKAECKVREERVTVTGDAAWIVYARLPRGLRRDGRAQDARCTDLAAPGGDWRMVHFPARTTCRGRWRAGRSASAGASRSSAALASRSSARTISPAGSTPSITAADWPAASAPTSVLPS
jgi:ketosteroid isomerase-like protein